MRYALIVKRLSSTLILTLALCAGLAACSSAPPRPLLPEEGAPPFSSLAEVKIDSSAKEHIVEILAPTPGYQCRVVYIGEAFRERDVYILLREPDPLYVYSAVQVKHRIATGVETKMPIRLLLQQVTYSMPADPEAYLDAGRSIVSVAAHEPEMKPEKKK